MFVLEEMCLVILHHWSSATPNTDSLEAIYQILSSLLWSHKQFLKWVHLLRLHETTTLCMLLFHLFLLVLLQCLYSHCTVYTLCIVCNDTDKTPLNHCFSNSWVRQVGHG